MKLVFNSTTEQALAKMTASLPQSLLLYGQKGSGLTTTALYLAGKQLAHMVEPTSTDGKIDPHKGVIRVEQIRDLYDRTKSIATSRQVIIIDQADRMNTVAQTAFLKLLEEPSPNIHFILTAHDRHRLLPTILSRLQQLHIQPISDIQTHRLVKLHGVTDETKLRQLSYLASGKPAELTRLITDQNHFTTQSTLIADARRLLQGTMHERLVTAYRYHSDRQAALDLLETVSTILNHSIKQKPTSELIARAEALGEAYDAIKGNGNVRLHLLAFVV